MGEDSPKVVGECGENVKQERNEMTVPDLKKKAKKLMTIVRIKLHQKSFEGLPYLWQRNGSDRLLIVFSAFTGDKRRFNYVTSFKDLKCDKLFVLDPWGCKGSYNLYENGQNYPEDITCRLLAKIVAGGGINIHIQPVLQKVVQKLSTSDSLWM